MAYWLRTPDPTWPSKQFKSQSQRLERFAENAYVCAQNRDGLERGKRTAAGPHPMGSVSSLHSLCLSGEGMCPLATRKKKKVNHCFSCMETICCGAAMVVQVVRHHA